MRSLAPFGSWNACGVWSSRTLFAEHFSLVALADFPTGVIVEPTTDLFSVMAAHATYVGTNLPTYIPTKNSDKELITMSPVSRFSAGNINIEKCRNSVN